MTEIIIPADSSLYHTVQQITGQRKMLFLAGLPGTGKSLLLQQCALLAEANGRHVHLLQYDLTRAAFETAENLATYPEMDGVTHPAIRKAVGLWARVGLSHWLEHFPEEKHFLLGEVPLIGNRLIELVQPHDDALEPHLADDLTLFLIPVPSTAVRQHIAAAREHSLKHPQHANETKDAPPNVMHNIWQQVAQLAQKLGLAEVKEKTTATYDPAVYMAVFQHLLRNRHHQTLPIDTILQPTSSAYDFNISGTELAATPEEVAAIMYKINTEYTAESLASAVAHWYK